METSRRQRHSRISANNLPYLNEQNNLFKFRQRNGNTEWKQSNIKSAFSTPTNQNTYSYMNKKNVGGFLQLQTYLHNICALKQDRRLSKVKDKQNKKDSLFLPCIQTKQQQNSSFQLQLLRIKKQKILKQLKRQKKKHKSSNSNFLPPIIPYFMYGMTMGMNMAMSLGNNNNNNNAVNQTPNSTNVSQQKRKSKKSGLLRKFRIIGYVVFFSVLFPRYSLVFGHIRLKNYLQKYLLQDNRQIRYLNDLIVQQFKQIPLYQQIRQIHQSYDSTIKRKQKEEPKIKISNEDSKQNYVVNLNIFKLIVDKLVQIFDFLVDHLDQQIYQFLAIGALNMSYYADQIFSIQQMSLLFCNPEKGSLKLTKLQEKAMLLSNFIIKKLVYQYLCRLAIDAQWHQQLAYYSGLNKKDLKLFRLICKQLQLCSFFIYQMAIKKFYTMVQSDLIGNFIKQSDDSFPLPLKTMKFSSIIQSLEVKQKLILQENTFGYDNKKFKQKSNKQKKQLLKKKLQKKKKKKKGKQIKEKQKKGKQKKGKQNKIQESQQNSSDNQQQIFEQFVTIIQQDPLNLIHSNIQYYQLGKIINQSMGDQYLSIQASILTIIDKLHSKIIQTRKTQYKNIHEQTMNVRNLLTKEQQILEGVVFLRDQDEKKQVLITRTLIQIYLTKLKQHEFYRNTKQTITILSSDQQKMTNSNSTISQKSKK